MTKFVQGTVLLVKADEWFYGPDGKSYFAAHGPVSIFQAEEVLGFVPKNSANWFARVGRGDGAVLIAGCKIHYIGVFENCPRHADVYMAPE
jgi:hypothetical protein